MILRDYQEHAIADARASCAAGRRAPLIVSPTGSGKTTIGGAIAVRHLAAGGSRVLWLAHRRELIEQAASRLTDFGLTVGVIAANACRPNPFARVQVASVQALRAREQTPAASLVVFDEAHHFPAAEWRGLAKAYASSVRIGLTATPERGDGQGLGELFDAIVVAATIRDLTDAGHLVPCVVVAPSAPLKSGQIAQRPVDAYVEHARERRAIVFAPHVKAARQYLDEFIAAGIPTGLVHGELPVNERSSVIRDYRAGRTRVLVNVNVLTEGFDDPPTSCAILARGCGTPGLYLQMVGRILRPAPGKRDAVLLDLRGVVHVHGRPDEDRSYSLEGRAIRLDDDAPAARFCLVCGAPLAGVACEECGKAPNELEAPKVTGTALVKYEKKRRESDDDRISTLARWLLVARSKGFKEGWAHAKYRAVYGDWAPFSIRRAALERSRGAA